MYSEELKAIKFFKNKSAKFVANVAPLLKPVKVCKGEYIYMKKDTIDGIYFINEGKAAYIDQQKKIDLTFSEIETGAYFGDVDFLAQNAKEMSKRCFAVKALSDMDLLFLRKQDLYHIDYEFQKEVMSLFGKSKKKLKYLESQRIKGLEWLEQKKPEVTIEKIEEDQEKEEERLSSISSVDIDKGYMRRATQKEKKKEILHSIRLHQRRIVSEVIDAKLKKKENKSRTLPQISSEEESDIIFYKRDQKKKKKKKRRSCKEIVLSDNDQISSGLSSLPSFYDKK